MPKKIILFALLLPIISLLFGCATLSKEGENVQIIKVTTNVDDVAAAETKLKQEGCTFVQNIEAPIAAGSTDDYYRLEIGIKNKTAEVGGNVVISSMKPNFGMPIFTKGKVYKCNRTKKSSEV